MNITIINYSQFFISVLHSTLRYQEISEYSWNLRIRCKNMHYLCLNKKVLCLNRQVFIFVSL